MRIASFVMDGRSGYGLVTPAGVLPASAKFTAQFPSLRDVLAAGAGGTPVSVAIRPAADVFLPPGSASAASWIKAAVVAGALATFAVIAGALYFGRRRTRRLPQQVGDPIPDDS